jgi:Uma2 family endonuclease
MAFVVDEAYLPAVLSAGPMTDEEFVELCNQYPDYLIELSAEGEIIVMPPTQLQTGARNQRIARQLGSWAERDRRGVAFDSSTGYVTPAGARRSPDASWISKKRLRDVDPEAFGRVPPDFVIELKSRTDRRRLLRQKMVEWIAAGAQLGWLIDPEARTVEIYRPGQEPEILANPTQVAGEGPVKGFVLKMARVWDPLS